MPTSDLSALVVLVLPALAVVAALKDLTSYTIPNWISLALLAAFGPAAFLSGAPLPAIGLCLLVGFAGLIGGMVMFALRWIGGGDAKLLAGCALWIGWPGVSHFLLWTTLGGGALAVGLLTIRKWAPLFAPVSAGPGWMTRLLTKDADVPYGVAIAVGALMAFPMSPLARGVF